MVFLLFGVLREHFYFWSADLVENEGQNSFEVVLRQFVVFKFETSDLVDEGEVNLKPERVLALLYGVPKIRFVHYL